MDDLALLVDLHKGANRQGPGGDSETERAIDLAHIDRNAALNIADIGCGTGASTLVLARLLNASITAVDVFHDFLDVLDTRARKAGVAGKITRVCASMDELPFEERTFDVMWSEGAIYNIGFQQGIANWQRYLKPGGLLVVSEITWTTNTRPSALQTHWDTQYPEIDTASSKISILERHGYTPLGYFVLPEQCWRDHYYDPMRTGFEDFLRRNGNSDAANTLVTAEYDEIALYDLYSDYYSYGVYIARTTGP